MKIGLLSDSHVSASNHFNEIMTMLPARGLVDVMVLLETLLITVKFSTSVSMLSLFLTARLYLLLETMNTTAMGSFAPLN